MHGSWGIDYSDGGLRAIRLARKGGRFQVMVAHEFVLSGPGEYVSRPRLGLTDLEREGLLKFLREVRPSVSDVLCVGYPGTTVFERVVSVPPITGERLYEALRFEVGQSVRSPINELLIRHRLLARGKSPEAELRALVVAAPREHVLVLAEDLRRSGLKTDLLEAEPLALANFLDFERPASLPFMALSIGRLRTDLVALAPVQVFTRSFPYGAGHLLVESPPAEAVPSLAMRLAKDVRSTCATAFGAGNARVPERVLVFGPGATSSALLVELARQLDVTLEPLRTFHRIHHELAQPPISGADLSRFGTALGLALAGLNAGQLSTPLVPVSRARRARRLAPLAALAALLVSSLLVGFTFLAVQENNLGRQFLLEHGPEVQSALAARYASLNEQLTRCRDEVVQLARIAAAPTTALGQLQSILETAASQLEGCHLLEVTVAREPRSSTLRGSARFRATGPSDKAEAKLNGIARLLPINGARVDREQGASGAVLVLSWQAEVGT